MKRLPLAEGMDLAQ